MSVWRIGKGPHGKQYLSRDQRALMYTIKVLVHEFMHSGILRGIGVSGMQLALWVGSGMLLPDQNPCLSR